eukprot:TRINITY_DN69497_c0_g1_i1.p1 TRINITY_DN69497_c0_g1~~TRINITY_DN69497_c0_g1_i1.p1  ORF type:complete len:416 (+),score=56.31 TRINITY_DN69497_c0_g1_i1:93-1250(+)
MADSHDDYALRYSNPGEGIRTALRVTAFMVRERDALAWRDADDHGSQPLLIQPEVAKLCHQATEAARARLPQSAGDERLARLRMPKSRCEAMLREGASLDDVARQAAVRLVESWIGVLRKCSVPQNQITDILVGLVHGDSNIEAGESRPSSAASIGQRRVRWRVPSPNPVPPPSDALGAALRRFVPRLRALNGVASACGSGNTAAAADLPGVVPSGDDKPGCEEEGHTPSWEFVDEVCGNLTLQAQMSPGWPITAERQALRRASAVDSDLGAEAPFFIAKSRMLQEGVQERRAPLSAAARIRLSGDLSWNTYEESSGCRRTALTPSQPVVMSRQKVADIPGPGAYGTMRSPLSSSGRPGSKLLRSLWPNAVVPGFKKRDLVTKLT